MMWQYYGGTWVWMFPTMLLVWALVIGVIVLTIRWLAAPPSKSETTMETLRRRLASGEITPDEYERTKKLLES
jgi:uncharacterized membrane protein